MHFPSLRPSFLLWLLFPFILDARSDAAEAKPNVLLIVVDDLGWRDLAVQGSRFYETPHVDQLAEEGVRFLRGYAACQVCSPSRASLMTGRYPARMGTTDWFGAKAGGAWKRNTQMLPAEYTDRLPHERVTVAEAFREAGYATFFAGKWHLGPNETDWPEYHGYQINKGGHDRGTPPGGYFSPYDNPRLEDGPAGEALPLRLADETAAFIRNQTDGPFFATLCFYTVHGPAQTTQSLWAKYREKAGTLPQPERRMDVERRRPIRIVQDNPIYGGMVEMMDTAVGRVLEAIDESGQKENTIVVFTSDNGGVASGDHWATSNLPLRGGKGYQWEGGVRVPFIVSWPQHLKPTVILDTPAIGTDLYPTLLELAGLPLRPDEHLDGTSLVPVLQGKALSARPLFWHYPHYSNQGGEPVSIILEADWKLIHYHESGTDELFRLGEDPMERTNVAADYPAHASRLRRTLDAWLEEMKADYPTANPDFEPTRFAAQGIEMIEQERPRRDAEAARILAADWEPNPTWWGSEPK